MPTITQLPLGRYEHGEPRPHEGGCWSRVDRYYSDDPEYMESADPGNRGLFDRIACDGPQDDSPLHHQNPNEGGYDGKRCPCCYLGHAHTQQLHARYLSSYEKAAQR